MKEEGLLKLENRVIKRPLTAKEFIRRFQNHILPKGFTRIRHYGFLSSSWKPKLRQLQQQLKDRATET